MGFLSYPFAQIHSEGTSVISLPSEAAPPHGHRLCYLRTTRQGSERAAQPDLKRFPSFANPAPIYTLWEPPCEFSRLSELGTKNLEMKFSLLLNPLALVLKRLYHPYETLAQFETSLVNFRATDLRGCLLGLYGVYAGYAVFLVYGDLEQCQRSGT
jgi:hypothetical protein